MGCLFFIFSFMLQQEELFLLLNLATQIISRWHVGQILGGIEVVAAVQHRVVCHIIVGIGMKNVLSVGIAFDIASPLLQLWTKGVTYYLVANLLNLIEY